MCHYAYERYRNFSEKDKNNSVSIAANDRKNTQKTKEGKQMLVEYRRKYYITPKK